MVEIRRTGSRASTKGSTEYFIGAVRVDPLFQARSPARVARASVTFEPGLVQLAYSSVRAESDCDSRLWSCARLGGPVEEIRPGDVVWIPAGEKHWHGATATTAMTHIAIQAQLDGKTADWMEKVSEEQYLA